MARVKVSTGVTGVRGGGGVAPSQSKRPLLRTTPVLGELTNIKTQQVPDRAQTRLLKPVVTLPVPVAPSTQPSKSAQPQISRREGTSLTRASSMSSMPVSTSSHLHPKGAHQSHAGPSLTASITTSRLASTSVIPTPGTIRKVSSSVSLLSSSNKANLRNNRTGVQVQGIEIKRVVHRQNAVPSSSKVAPSAPIVPMAPKVPAGARQRVPRAHPSGPESVLRPSLAKTSTTPPHSTNTSHTIKPLRKSATKASRGPIIPAVPLFDELMEGSSQDTEMSSVSPRASVELPSPDIDEYDRDPAMVAEYQADIIQYMRLKELQFMPDAQYMDHQPDMIWAFRTQLIQWLFTVHDRFDLLQETLHLCINLLDRFLSATVIPLTQLQLAGIVALSLASKFEETQAPSLAYLAEMAADAYSVSQIKAAEIGMLKVLNYDLGAPGPMTFLRRISRVDQFDVDIRTLTKYLIDVTLCDERFLSMPASKIAAVGYCASMRLLNRGEWTLDHVVAAGYTESALIAGVNMVLTLLEDPENTHPALWDKYREKRCMRASEYVQSLGVAHLRLLQY
ncbi:hypothetical protein CPC16_007346 [Podila verticillata]|nr:hypothetical protein CPC16_007346 [Podila verticillata]